MPALRTAFAAELLDLFEVDRYTGALVYRDVLDGRPVKRVARLVDVGDGVVKRMRLTVPELDDQSFDLNEVLFLLMNRRWPSAIERYDLDAAQGREDAEALARDAMHAQRVATQNAHRAARHAAQFGPDAPEHAKEVRHARAS